MDNTKIKEFFNEIILDKFILNFIPGLLLFFVLTTFINISIGEGFTSLLIITSISWVLGILLEFVFFKKTYKSRRESYVATPKETLNLLFGKIGMSILITCVCWINIDIMLEFFGEKTMHDIYPYERNEKIIYPSIKFILFTLAGLSLYITYLFKK